MPDRGQMERSLRMAQPLMLPDARVVNLKLIQRSLMECRVHMVLMSCDGPCELPAWDWTCADKVKTCRYASQRLAKSTGQLMRTFWPKAMLEWRRLLGCGRMRRIMGLRESQVSLVLLLPVLIILMSLGLAMWWLLPY